MEGRAWLAALPEELTAQRRVLTGLIDRIPAGRWRRRCWSAAHLAAARPMSFPTSTRHCRGRCPAWRGRCRAGDGLWKRWWWRRFRSWARSSTCYGTRPARPASTSGGSSPSSPMAPSSIWRSWPMPRSRCAGRAGGAPDFVSLYQAPASAASDPRMPADGGASGGEPPDAYAVTGEQVREWAFLGWIALIDADKYLRRGSPWEAARAARGTPPHLGAVGGGQGAMYPWHGLSQVLDHDPADLPPGIESTVAGLARPICAAPRAPVPECSPGQRGRRPAAPGRPPGGDGRLRHPRALPRSVITASTLVA